ncbi:hypothetical protein JB92DRAFT_3030464 [Gautieria morchelliformis]|nr:hypothetical protein JB92DRAFT_3030464 [Gautieria morchelliformis]
MIHSHSLCMQCLPDFLSSRSSIADTISIFRHTRFALDIFLARTIYPRFPSYEALDTAT